ncbi:MAG: hypothetical protein R3F49_04285 [Planctomycetota bacterium]
MQASAPSSGARFGAALALGAAAPGGLLLGRRLLVVGAPGATSAGVRSRASRRSLSRAPRGSPHLELAAPRRTVVGHFGASVAVVGDANGLSAGPAATCVAVAAPGDAGGGPGAGAVYLFDLAGHLLDVRRAAPDVHRGQPQGARYGERIAALGAGRLAIAAPARGAVEVCRVEGGMFVREALFEGSPIVGFGLGLAGAGDTLIIGAPFAGPGAVGPGAVGPGDPGQGSPGPGDPVLGGGRVFVLHRSGGAWVSAPSLGPLACAGAGGGALGAIVGADGDELGHALALGHGGAALVISAPSSDLGCGSGAACDVGAALVLATQPPARAFCERGATGTLEALGSGRLSDGRFMLLAGDAPPDEVGVLYAALGGVHPASGSCVCLAPPVLRVGAAESGADGLWQLAAHPYAARLHARSPGVAWSFQVAWRGARASSGLTLSFTP